MSIKSSLAKVYAFIVKKKINHWSSRPHQTQQKVFKNLLTKGAHTVFGKDHQFDKITTYEEFVNRVPVRDYEGLRSYVDRVVAGEKNILWPGKPLYFAKTSGTTSGAKYIPITAESMPTHIAAAKNAILCYIAETGNTDFVNGKMIFLQGSPVLEEKNGIKIGRLSGIVAHFVPGYLQTNRMPSWNTNLIEDWEQKVDAIVEETFQENMQVISGIPPWVQMYFEKLTQKTGKKISELFPGFSLFIYGGVNYEPYRASFEKLIGRSIPSIELYPASEGFFAFQDSQTEKGMLLQLDSGIFYEFIRSDTFFDKNPKRILLDEVEKGVNYVMIISTTAGLWGYNIGDTISFVSTAPYRVIVTGRIKHFISAFGEHVIGKEVEESLRIATYNTHIRVNEFTVAPQVNPKEGLPYHEWFIEFDEEPQNMEQFIQSLDQALQNQNTYYKDLVQGKVLSPLRISKVKKKGFQDYMRSIGKLGGQNKTPRLSDNRKIADALQPFTIL